MGRSCEQREWNERVAGWLEVVGTGAIPSMLSGFPSLPTQLYS